MGSEEAASEPGPRAGSRRTVLPAEGRLLALMIENRHGLAALVAEMQRESVWMRAPQRVEPT